MITLGIIGVVAAITLPTLIQNYRRHVVANKLKTTVSILGQALQRSVADNGSPDNWDFDKDTFGVYFKPYLRILKEGTVRYDVKHYGGSEDGQGQASLAHPYMKTYKLSNGAIITFTKDKTLYRRGAFEIFLKEKKDGYFIYGKDIFSFSFILGTDDGKYYISSTSDYRPSHGFICRQSHEYLKEICVNGSGGRGYNWGIGCSALIECNGWEFPKDYPIKL